MQEYTNNIIMKKAPFKMKGYSYPGKSPLRQDWTGTTQGQVHQDSIILHFQDCIRISEKAQREMDSVDNYMRHWYEVLDTNSNGDIDDTE